MRDKVQLGDPKVRNVNEVQIQQMLIFAANHMANGQPFFVQLSKQVAALEATR